jgi:predicted RND superfamily exporter protein
VAEFWKAGDWQHDEAEARYVVSRFDFAPGEIRRRRLLADDERGAVLTVFLKDANFRDTETLITRLRQAEERLLTPVGIELGLAGDIATSQALIPAVVKGQMASLPLALVGVFASVFLLAGSAGLALAALVPVTLAALWLLGGLGFAGLPLGVATSMFFVISIGLGVDSHSIHLVLRAQEKWRENDPDPIRSALREVRPAILVNSLAIAAGFGLLAASTVPPNRNLGLLIAAAIVLGCGITLGGLGSILELASARKSSRRPACEASPETAARQGSSAVLGRAGDCKPIGPQTGIEDFS